MESKYKTFKDLLIWQKGMDLTEMVYHLTSKMPETEKFGLISQARRSACSVPLNIAEGYGRKSKLSFQYFLRNSLASIYELETCIELSYRLNFITKDEQNKISLVISEETAMIIGLINKIGISKTNPN